MASCSGVGFGDICVCVVGTVVLFTVAVRDHGPFFGSYLRTVLSVWFWRWTVHLQVVCLFFFVRIQNRKLPRKLASCRQPTKIPQQRKIPQTTNPNAGSPFCWERRACPRLQAHIRRVPFGRTAARTRATSPQSHSSPPPNDEAFPHNAPCTNHDPSAHCVTMRHMCPYRWPNRCTHTSHIAPIAQQSTTERRSVPHNAPQTNKDTAALCATMR